MQTLDVEILFGILIFIANTFLGVLVFFRNWKSWTNRLYFLLVLQINAYIATNFISLHPELINSTDQLFWIRIVMFVCSLIGPTLLCLIHTFPGDSIAMKKRFALPLFVLMFSSAALSLLPYVFTDLQYVNGEPIPTPGPGIPVFFLDFIGLFIASFVLLYYKWKHSVGLVRAQLRTIAVGTTFSFSLMGISTVIFVVILKSSSFVFLGPLYTVFLMAAIAYAIINYNLFNIKIIATQAFVVIISIIFLARIFISQSHSNRLVDTIILVATILFGYLLIRSVKIEIRSKEEISLLAKRLSDTNWELARINEQLRIIDQRKSEFVSIVSHQLRTPITAIKGYSSLLLEDAFGALAEKQKPPVEKIFISSKRIAEMVTDFLDISKIEQGTMSYNFVSVDIKSMLIDLMEEFAPIAKDKHISMSAHFDEYMKYIVTADEGKLRQILSNIMDNSVKYTPRGDVHISLEKDDARGTITVRMKDSGIGLSQDDIHHLFGKFTRGSGGQRENTAGSGLGLYVAMKMLEAMHGKIWVDSPGPQKGSTFAIELLSEEEV